MALDAFDELFAKAGFPKEGKTKNPTRNIVDILDRL
jgi:hypothetical protein